MLVSLFFTLKSALFDLELSDQMLLIFAFFADIIISFSDSHQTTMGHGLSEVYIVRWFISQFSLLPNIGEGYISISESKVGYLTERLIELRAGSLTAYEKRSVSRVEYLLLRSRVCDSFLSL